MTKKDKKQTLPERHEALRNAYDLIRTAENFLLDDPENPLVKDMLYKATNILKVLRAADERAFWEYANQLSVSVHNTYPTHHSRQNG